MELPVFDENEIKHTEECFIVSMDFQSVFNRRDINVRFLKERTFDLSSIEGN